jgi:trk system potassium uptake protein TrkA
MSTRFIVCSTRPRYPATRRLESAWVGSRPVLNEELVVVHVVVVGCGRVGSSLALSLTSSGHTVAVIDRRSEAFSRLGQSFTGTTIAGIGFDRDRLVEAGIERAGALAAVTNGDNSNILIARVARETFNIERVVARIYDPKRAAIYQRLGIPTVATVAWTTERVLRRVLPDEPAVEWVDASARVMLVERPVPSAWAGRALDELERPGVVRVVALGRLGSSQIPRPGLVIQEGDVAYLGVAGDSLADVDQLLAAGPGKGGH